VGKSGSLTHRIGSGIDRHNLFFPEE